MREKLNLVTAYRRATIWTGAPGGHMTGAEGAKAFEKNRYRPMYAGANMGHPSSLVGKENSLGSFTIAQARWGELGIPVRLPVAIALAQQLDG
jgi:hypothetical protein